MWKNQTWLVLDSETSGLNHTNDRIIEIGAILMKDGQITERFSALCNPKQSLPEIIIKITGITDELLQPEPEFAAHVSKLLALIDKADVIVAYNEPFDRGFFEAEFNRLRMSLPNRHWVDPLVLVRKLDERPYNKLTDVCERYRIKVERAHRADGDAEMTAQLMLELKDRLPDDLLQLIGLQMQWRAQQDADYKAKRALKAKNRTAD